MLTKRKLSNERCFSQRKFSCLVYYATISCNDNNYKAKLYKESCKTIFKKHYSNHKRSFNVPLYKHDTKLSTEYWNLQNEATKSTDILEEERNIQAL